LRVIVGSFWLGLIDFLTLRKTKQITKMAGSYSHLKNGWSMIENMGDAHECVEELLWLVERGIGREAAEKLLDAEFYRMQRRETPKDEHLKYVEGRMNA
jgi:hypothetical protein